MKRFFLAFYILISYTSLLYSQCWQSMAITDDTSTVLLAIKDDNTLWDFSNYLEGVQIGNQNIWNRCFVSHDYTFFLMAQDSSLWGWGGNSGGELGIGNTIDQPSIIQLNVDKWIDVACSWESTTAIKGDGTLWFWGRQSWNNLVLSPIQIGSSNDWKSVQSYYNGFIALKNNGSIWRGNNAVNPTQIGNEYDWKYIWSDWSSRWWAIKNNGTLWYNGFQVGTSNDWESIQGKSSASTYAIKTDGSLWFLNDYPFNPETEPTQVLNILNCEQISISAGTNELRAIHDNGKLWIEDIGNIAECFPTVDSCELETEIYLNQQLELGEMALFGIEGGGMGHWQTFVEGFGWLTLPENGYYFGGTSSDNGGIFSVSCENQNQLFRVIESELGCIDTSGVIAIPLIPGCEFSTCDSTIIVFETVYDTVLVSVTDTLIIDLTITDVNSSEVINTLSIYPNPSSTHITIDYGNFALMSGYQLSIENSVGQQVFQTAISQATDYLSLSTWGGNGMYFVHIIDPQGNTIDVRKIVLE